MKTIPWLQAIGTPSALDDRVDRLTGFDECPPPDGENCERYHAALQQHMARLGATRLGRERPHHGSAWVRLTDWLARAPHRTLHTAVDTTRSLVRELAAAQLRQRAAPDSDGDSALDSDPWTPASASVSTVSYIAAIVAGHRAIARAMPPEMELLWDWARRGYYPCAYARPKGKRLLVY